MVLALSQMREDGLGPFGRADLHPRGKVFVFPVEAKADRVMRFTVYLERLLPENVRHLAPVEQVFSDGPQQIRRWTLLSTGPAATARLRCLALASLGRWQLSRLAGRVLPLLAANTHRPVRVEFVLVRHAPQERMPHSPSRHHQGWQFLPGGRWEGLSRETLRCQVPDVRQGKLESGRSQTGRLLLGYGGSIQVGTDGFGLHPDQRWRRCAGLFAAESRVTDPLAFLKRLHHKSRYRAGRARAVLDRLKDGLSGWLGWDVAQSLERGRPELRWRSTARARQIPAMVALDIARHAFDAAARLGETNPLRQPGVVLFERMQDWGPPGQQAAFVRLLDGWFPNLQFILALDADARRRFPRRLRQQRLPIPEPQPRSARVAPRRLAKGAVLLVDLDGRLPNLALMKLSRHFRAQGRVVALHRGIKSLPSAETVLASCVFNTPASARHVEVLRRQYGPEVQLGGSGVDLRLRLEPAIEALPPDYSLYPELGDRALGFLTRGCRFHCPFCVVPVKEGAPRQVSDLDGLLQGRRKLILLDDNLLAHPDALRLIEELVRRGLAVNFNQTLDLRLLTPEAAALLRRLHCANSAFTRRNLYFSLNDTRHLELMRERYALLQPRPKDNMAFVCMYGFNTSLAEDVARFRFLRSLPGAYVFVQRYLPVLGGPPPDHRRLFDDRADALLTELVRIVFRQNMKSVETYYRWLAIQYAAQCGRIHSELIETLFRYNARSRMGRFVARLEALCQRAPGAGDSLPREGPEATWTGPDGHSPLCSKGQTHIKLLV